MFGHQGSELSWRLSRQGSEPHPLSYDREEAPIKDHRRSVRCGHWTMVWPAAARPTKGGHGQRQSRQPKSPPSPGAPALSALRSCHQVRPKAKHEVVLPVRAVIDYDVPPIADREELRLVPESDPGKCLAGLGFSRRRGIESEPMGSHESVRRRPGDDCFNPAMGVAVADLVGSVAQRFRAAKTFDDSRWDALRPQHQGEGAGVPLAMSFLDIEQKVSGRVEGWIDAPQIQRVGKLFRTSQVCAERSRDFFPVLL